MLGLKHNISFPALRMTLRYTHVFQAISTVISLFHLYRIYYYIYTSFCVIAMAYMWYQCLSPILPCLHPFCQDRTIFLQDSWVNFDFWEEGILRITNESILLILPWPVLFTCRMISHTKCPNIFCIILRGRASSFQF